MAIKVGLKLKNNDNFSNASFSNFNLTILIPTFQFIVLLSVVMYASAGDLAPVAYSYATPSAYTQLSYNANPAYNSYGSSSQNVIRSYDGTISQYSKAVDSPFSSVRKYDTRITNNQYTPQLVQYAAPAHHHQQILTTVPHAHTYAHSGAYVQPSYAHSGAYVQPSYAHSGAYVQPAAHHVAYSPAAAVTHVSFDGLGAHYAW